MSEGKRLYIDLDRCNRCPKCVIECSYFYHPGNNGITSLREIAAYAVICRQCEEGTCVLACPKEALEKQKDKILKRYNLRCIKCNSCSFSCPFGTILPEFIPYAFSHCDFCLDRRQKDIPLCVKTCPYGALKYGKFEPNEENDEFLVGDNLIIRAKKWLREPKKAHKK